MTHTTKNTNVSPEIAQQIEMTNVYRERARTIINRDPEHIPDASAIVAEMSRVADENRPFNPRLARNVVEFELKIHTNGETQMTQNTTPSTDTTPSTEIVPEIVPDAPKTRRTRAPKTPKNAPKIVADAPSANVATFADVSAMYPKNARVLRLATNQSGRVVNVQNTTNGIRVRVRLDVSGETIGIAPIVDGETMLSIVADDPDATPSVIAMDDPKRAEITRKKNDPRLVGKSAKDARAEMEKIRADADEKKKKNAEKNATRVPRVPRVVARVSQKSGRSYTIAINRPDGIRSAILASLASGPMDVASLESAHGSLGNVKRALSGLLYRFQIVRDGTSFRIATDADVSARQSLVSSGQTLSALRAPKTEIVPDAPKTEKKTRRTKNATIAPKTDATPSAPKTRTRRARVASPEIIADAPKTDTQTPKTTRRTRAPKNADSVSPSA